MKTLKIILAWLDWSTYCKSYMYERPKTLCSLFWRSFFAILTLPVGWPTHIINVFQPKNDWIEERESGFKPNIWKGIGIHLLVIICGFATLKGVEQEFGVDWLHIADAVWMSYGKMLVFGIMGGIAGIIALAILIASVYGIWWVGKWCVEYAQEKLSDGESERAEKEPSWAAQTYRAIKDKYCPIIDWSDLN